MPAHHNTGCVCLIRQSPSAPNGSPRACGLYLRTRTHPITPAAIAPTAGAPARVSTSTGISAPIRIRKAIMGPSRMSAMIVAPKAQFRKLLIDGSRIRIVLPRLCRLLVPLARLNHGTAPERDRFRFVRWAGRRGHEPRADRCIRLSSAFPTFSASGPRSPIRRLSGVLSREVWSGERRDIIGGRFGDPRGTSNFRRCNGRTRTEPTHSMFVNQKTATDPRGGQVKIASTRAPFSAPSMTAAANSVKTIAQGQYGSARYHRPYRPHWRLFSFCHLKRDRLRAADEPDEALKRSLRELIVGDRGLIAFLNRHARR